MVVIQSTRELKDNGCWLAREYMYSALFKTYVTICMHKLSLYGQPISAPLALHLVQGWDYIEYSVFTVGLGKYNVAR